MKAEGSAHVTSRRVGQTDERTGQRLMRLSVRRPKNNVCRRSDGAALLIASDG